MFQLTLVCSLASLLYSTFFPMVFQLVTSPSLLFYHGALRSPFFLSFSFHLKSQVEALHGSRLNSISQASRPGELEAGPRQINSPCFSSTDERRAGLNLLNFSEDGQPLISKTSKRCTCTSRIFLHLEKRLQGFKIICVMARTKLYAAFFFKYRRKIKKESRETVRINLLARKRAPMRAVRVGSDSDGTPLGWRLALKGTGDAGPHYRNDKKI